MKPANIDDAIDFIDCNSEEQVHDNDREQKDEDIDQN